ncbi:MAG: TIM-barrel domain-containing protein [Chitinispirillaceae bacterium]|jgi:alpha-D-xyloside xylohydrolase
MKHQTAVVAVGKILTAMFFSVQMCFGLNVTSYVTNTDGITFTCNTGLMRIQICQADIAHLTYTPTSSFPSKTQLVVTRTWPTPTFTTSDVGDTVTLQTSRLNIKVSKSTANVNYVDLTNSSIVSETGKSVTATTYSGVSTNTITTTYTSPTNEGLFGLGQKMVEGGGTPYNNLKGVSSVEIGQEYGNPDLNAVPVLISTRGYGIYWDNYSQSTFYGADNNNTQYHYTSNCGQIVDYYFFYGPTIDTVIAKYRTTTGTVPLFPKWCYGLIQSKDHYASQAEYLAVKTGYRSNNIPVDCIVQDWQYWSTSGDNSYQGCNCFDANWTNVKAMVDTVHAANIHTMISIWSEIGTNAPQYSTLNGLGALWPSSGNDHFLDPFDSAGRETFWNNMRDQLFKAQGWDSWWLDNDEPLPYPYALGSYNRSTVPTAMGTNCLYYNAYPVYLTKMGYNNWRRDISGKRFVILHRCTFAGEQAHSAMTWNSDINCNFGTLANSIPCGLGATITGIPYWCTDIGGYWGNSVDFTTAANRELMTRWFQYGAFCPVFRIHGNMEAGQGKELYSSTWDATTKANLLLTDKLHYRLIPYNYSLAWMTTNNNYTPMRHLVMDFTSDTTVKNIGNEYMFGPAFLVTPVTTQGATTQSVYVPAGTWYNFWTGASLTGGQRTTVNAPLNQIPLLIRAGSIVPMGPEIQYATQRADTIELRVYKGASGSFTLYEDEGDNYNYESGSHATIPMSYNDATGKITIGTRVGSFTGMLTNRVFTVVFVSTGHGSDEPMTANPDCIVNYTGVGVTACPATGVCASCGSSRAMTPKSVTLKTAQQIIALAPEFSGRAKEITLYDCSGRLLRTLVTRRQRIDVARDFGLPAGVYIVHVKAER